MSKKTAVVVVFAGLVILVMAYATSLHYRQPSHLLSGTLDETGAYSHVEDGEYWTIEATMPQRTALFRWWKPGPDEHVRTAIESWLLGDIAEFKKNIGAGALTPEQQAVIEGSAGTYSYDAKYQRFQSADDRLMSYEYDIYVDTGGAHPNTYFKTFVFDRDGTMLKLADLFTPSSYLERLAATSTAQIMNDLGTRLKVDPTGALFADGLTPKEENFSNFVIDGDTLVLLFPPYQVAAYAAGPFEVRIPLSNLADVLRPEWK
jgi:hypothetical protein